eukprot:gene20441-27230_t
MNPSIRIETTDVLGKHVRSELKFSAGQLALTAATYAFVTYDSEVPKRCDYCLACSQSLLRCSRSKWARYCSREHQKLAWQQGYKQECTAVVASMAKHRKLPPPTVRLAARVLWRHQRSLDSGEEEDENMSYAAICSLLSHWDKIGDEQKQQFAQMAVLVREYMEGGTSEEGSSQFEHIGNKDIAMLLARFACNNHTIADEELRPIGVGIYPLGALVNHSCEPNCMQSFKGAAIQFRAVRGIEAGDQITISYIELAATRLERRETLFLSYHFDIDGARPATSPSHALPSSGTSSIAMDTDPEPTPALTSSTSQASHPEPAAAGASSNAMDTDPDPTQALTSSTSQASHPELAAAGTSSNAMDTDPEPAPALTSSTASYPQPAAACTSEVSSPPQVLAGAAPPMPSPSQSLAGAPPPVPSPSQNLVGATPPVPSPSRVKAPKVSTLRPPALVELLTSLTDNPEYDPTGRLWSSRRAGSQGGLDSCGRPSQGGWDPLGKPSQGRVGLPGEPGRLLLRVYQGQQAPPWRCDRRDEAFSQLEVTTAASKQLPNTWLLAGRGSTADMIPMVGGVQVS